MPHEAASWMGHPADFTSEWNTSLLPKPSGSHPVRYRQLSTTSSGWLASFSAGASTRNRWPSLVTTYGLPLAVPPELTVAASNRGLGIPASKDVPSVFTFTAKNVLPKW